MADFFAEDFAGVTPKFQGPVASDRPKYYADDINPNSALGDRGPDVTGDMAWHEKLFAGAGAWMTDKALGAQQRVVEARKFLADKNITSEDRSRLDEVAKGLEAEAVEKKRIDAALNRTGWGTAGRVMASLPAAYVAGPTLAGAAAFGGAEGFTEPTTGDESVLMNTGKGALFGTAGYGVAKGLEGGVRVGSAAAGAAARKLGLDDVADSLGRPIKERASRIAAAAREGVALRLGDLTQNPAVMKLENFLSAIPFTGQAKKMGSQADDVIGMVNKTLEESRPASLKVPDEATVAGMSARDLRRLLPPGSNVLNLSDQAIKALPYSALEHAGLRAPFADTGDALTAAVRAGYGREKQAAAQAYDAVSQLAKQTNSPPVALDGLRQAAKDALDKYPDYFQSLQNQSVVRVLNDVVGSTAPRPGVILGANGQPLAQKVAQVGFDEARDLRSILGSLSRQAERQIQAGTVSDAKAAGSLMQLYRAITDDLNHWGTAVADPAVGAAYKLADKTFKEGVVRFRESPSLKQVIRKDFDSDKAFQTLVRPGGRNVAEDALFAVGPGQRQVLEHAVLEDLVGSGTKPAVDVARAAKLGAPEVSAAAAEFNPTAFVQRARQLREPISAIMNDDTKYTRFLEQLDLINATKRGVTAGLDPATGQKLLAPFVLHSTHGLAIPGGRATSELLGSRALKRVVATRPLIDETTPRVIARALRAPPIALGGEAKSVLEATLSPDDATP